MKSFLLSMAVLGLFSLGVNAEDKCPISGKAVDANVKTLVNGKSVGFCCEKCQKKFEENLGVKDEGPGKCPISQKDADKATRMVKVVNETVYFCCAKCAKKYTEEHKIAIEDKGAAGAKCPVSGKDAVADAKIVHNGKTVYFCCGKCCAKYAAEHNIVVVDKGASGAKCPISGEDVDAEKKVVQVKATAEYYCCEKCQAKAVQALAKKG